MDPCHPRRAEHEPGFARSPPVHIGSRGQLELAELTGGITLAKLAEVATALDCSLVYVLVPNATIEGTVRSEARRIAASTLGYASRTMTLEAQDVRLDRQSEALDRLSQELIDRGDLWRDPLRGWPAPRSIP